MGSLMPGTIALISTFAAAYLGGTSVVLATAVYYGTSAALYAGLSFGLQAISNALRPKPPGPEDVRNSVRNAVSHRIHHVGRRKISGTWVFGATEDGNFHKVLTTGTGQLTAILEHWIDDKLVELDVSGNVLTEPFDGNCRIETRLGLPTETHYANLATAFPGKWTANHRGDGMSSIYAYQDAVPAEKITEVFPNLTQTNFSFVADCEAVWNPVEDVTEYDDNAAAIILHYLRHPDGARIKDELLLTPMALAGWQAAYERCDEAVPLKGGGTEKRYRIWDSWATNERPADIMGRFLAACDGRMVPTPDGGMTLDIGTWENRADIALTQDNIVGWNGLRRGRDIVNSANVVRAIYTSSEHGFQSTDAQPWEDADDILAFGEKPTDINLQSVPSHGQARRLMKLTLYRARPKYSVTFQCLPAGLNAFGKRFVPVNIEIGGELINEVFEVQAFDFINGPGGAMLGFNVSLISMPSAAFTWDAATEQGDPPPYEEIAEDAGVPVPENFSVALDRLLINSQYFPIARLTFDAPPSASLRTEARMRKSTDTQWFPIPVDDAATEAQSSILDDNSTYEFQVRHVATGGSVSIWEPEPPLSLDVVANPTAPAPLVAFTATSGENGRSVFSFSTPNDVNFDRAVVYRSPAGVTLNKSTHPKIIVFLGRNAVAVPYTYGEPSVVPTLIVNGTFTGNITGWTAGSGWAYGTNNAVRTNTGVTGNLSQSIAFVAGDKYRTAFDLVSITSGQFRLVFSGGTAVGGTYRTTTGTHFQTLTALTGNTLFQNQGNTTFAGTIDNVVAFKETLAMVDAGDWDFHAFAANSSGVESATEITQSSKRIY
jgi:hypothetical protein